MHALIIEDESVVATTIEEFLRECGFTSFDVAPSAHSAIVAAALRRPDMITSDVQLKPGCGIATVETISQGSTIPTIFITGNPEKVTRRLPSYRVIDKPFSRTALIAAAASAMLEISDDDSGKGQNPNAGNDPKASRV